MRDSSTGPSFSSTRTEPRLSGSTQADDATQSVSLSSPLHDRQRAFGRIALAPTTRLKAIADVGLAQVFQELQAAKADQLPLAFSMQAKRP